MTRKPHPSESMQRHVKQQLAAASKAGRVVGAVFGLIFFGVGLTIIIFLWGAPFGDFHSPPLFFRITGSLIALGPLVMGGALALAAIFGKGFASAKSLDGIAGSSSATSQGAYTCPRCGAPLADQADVSPHGDTKCRYCNAWFNVHQS